MDLQDLKRWHWMLIGLIAGALWAGSRLFYGINIDDGDPENQTGTFERVVMATKEAPAFVDFIDNGNVYVSDLKVYPAMPDNSREGQSSALAGSAGQVQWVTGTIGRRRFKRDGREWQTRAFRYKASVPFVPRKDTDYIADNWVPYGRFKPIAGYIKPAATPYPSIINYLDELNRKYGSGSVKYRYAWWEGRAAIMTIYPLGGLVLIGGVWPILLGLMIGAGFGGKVKKETYDLSRYSGESKATMPKTADTMTDADRAQLAALEAELEKNLASVGKATPRISAEADVPQIRNLSEGKSVDTQKAPEKVDPAKAFGDEGGAYYPTEIHAKPKE